MTVAQASCLWGSRAPRLADLPDYEHEHEHEQEED
jgi:hypothetical protein